MVSWSASLKGRAVAFAAAQSPSSLPSARLLVTILSCVMLQACLLNGMISGLSWYG